MHCVGAEAQNGGQPVFANIGEFQPVRFAQHAADRVELVHHGIEQHQMIGAA